MSREGSWRRRKWRKCIIWLCSWHPAAGQGNLAGLTAAWRQETGQNGPCNGTLQLDRATWLGWQRLGSKKLDRMDQEKGSSGKHLTSPHNWSWIGENQIVCSPLDAPWALARQSWTWQQALSWAGSRLASGILAVIGPQHRQEGTEIRQHSHCLVSSQLVTSSCTAVFNGARDPNWTAFNPRIKCLQFQQHSTQVWIRMWNKHENSL